MITTPTLLIHTSRCPENIQTMFSKAQKNHLEFRPHFKTHQSLTIGSWFKDLGINKITVSSVTMAEYFSADWDDITIAFSVNILEIDKINEIAKSITLNLLVESEETARFLFKKIRSNIEIFIKIDVGYHRTGIAPEDINEINKILNVINHSTLISFKGFLGHAGHSYQCRTKECVLQVHRESLDIMRNLKEKYQPNYPSLVISLGDTPGCSLASDFTGVDEIRPGNFVFYDLTQHQIGSNEIDQIAVSMACPIVAIHKNRGEIIIYGGGVHFAKDKLEDKEGIIYGRIVEKKESGWGKIIPGMYVKSLSQEHGTVSVPPGQIEKYKIGDLLYILPVHSCMTANSMGSYRTLEGGVISRLRS